MALQLNFNQWYFFYMVAIHKGVRHAAKALCVSPPAVSAQLKRLEDGLGYKLLRRESGGFTLTPMGEKIFPEVERLFDQAAYLEKHLKKLDDGKEQEFLVGGHFVHLQCLVPKKMPYFELGARNCLVQLVGAPQDVLLEKLRRDEIHVAFVEHEVDATGLCLVEIGRTKTIILACNNNPFGQEGPIDLQDLTAEHLLLPQSDSGFSQHLEQHFAKKKLVIQRAERFTLPANKRLLPTSLCISFFPEYFLDEDVNMTFFHKVELTEPLPEMPIYLAFKPELRTDTHIQTLLDVVLKK